MAQTGINFTKCNVYNAAKHNGRDPKYIAAVNASPNKHYSIFEDRTSMNKSWTASAYDGKSLVQLLNEIRVEVKDKTGQKLQEKDRIRKVKDKRTGKIIEKTIAGSSPIREGVCPVKENTTIEDFQPVIDWFAARHAHVIRIDIHHDEGHVDPVTGERKYNHHAHVIVDWMDHETGRSVKLGKADMSELQTVLADALGMERGTPKEETNKEHLSTLEYREKAAGENLAKLQTQLSQLELEKRTTEMQVTDLQSRKTALQKDVSGITAEKEDANKQLETLTKQKHTVESALQAIRSEMLNNIGQLNTVTHEHLVQSCNSLHDAGRRNVETIDTIIRNTDGALQLTPQEKENRDELDRECRADISAMDNTALEHHEGLLRRLINNTFLALMRLQKELREAAASITGGAFGRINREIQLINARKEAVRLVKEARDTAHQEINDANAEKEDTLRQLTEMQGKYESEATARRKAEEEKAQLRREYELRLDKERAEAFREGQKEGEKLENERNEKTIAANNTRIGELLSELKAAKYKFRVASRLNPYIENYDSCYSQLNKAFMAGLSITDDEIDRLFKGEKITAQTQFDECGRPWNTDIQICIARSTAGDMCVWFNRAYDFSTCMEQLRRNARAQMGIPEQQPKQANKEQTTTVRRSKGVSM